ncbi:efflux RND transporter periplasmic adaptor subunit [Botrimarina hoheduenensis]|uniref:Toluene efflux pump periplasmic linker protein TtgD n=1 Tax=Botrimarina hoheduenensis TaxID=2528000 RepID=A0A5C5WF49_9BACT|nr:efflux RND transporter periplasmic adaptor subunit [Botrimarina hoheduenensis]TWT48731.1 Toluene efflux pump periplasmic linker protein TtgD precursor [Botrimarina hoheduenensis]
MTRWALRLGRYGFLTALTAVAAFVMWWVSRPNTDPTALDAAAGVRQPAGVATARMAVYVAPIRAELCDITVKYSGKIRPWETYSLGFEIGGRVAQLGENAEGKPLDDGDPVEAGQLLAQLDDRIFRARLSEAAANLELAASDLKRSERLRQLSPGALAESDYQNDLTQATLTRAAREIALKNLEDATLYSPVTGSISRRMVESGESVNAHATIFEVVENDRLRLVLNVPEARVRELEVRRRKVRDAIASGATGEDAIFRARVQLESLDVYGRPWPSIDAEVYRIAQLAEPATGLFEVEVFIPNDDGLLRPGMVATANVVTDRVLAYRAPEAAVIFRESKTYLYSTDTVDESLDVMFWDIGQASAYRARRIELSDYIDQGDTIVIPASTAHFDNVVLRGQHRLRDGQPVRVVALNGEEAAPDSPAEVAETSASRLN